MDPYDLIRNPLGVISGGNGGNSPSGGGAGAYYKCVSVDTANNKWTGNLAIIDGETGVWSFAETVTPDRPINKIIPQVGKVYNENCTFMVSGFDTGLLIPSDGLVFYAPLSVDYKDTVQGLEPTQTTGTFTEYNGKKMLETDNTGSIYWTGGNFLPKDTAPCSIFAIRYLKSYGERYIYGFGNTDSRNVFAERVWGNDLYSFTPNEWNYQKGDPTGVLKSICITRDASGIITLYENGTLKGTSTDSNSYSNNQIFIGYKQQDYSNEFISDFAIYNRALNEKEVLSMHNNLMP